MTFRTLSLEEYTDEESARNSYGRGMAASAVMGLNAYTWPNPAAVFAKRHSLAIEYIDNAWIRVAVNAAIQ